MSNVVITHLLTAEPDPQRGVCWPANLDNFQDLLTSVKDSHTVVINDCLDEGHRVDNTGVNVYIQRHGHSLQYLKDHPGIDNVFCVDGSDVRMLRPPWPHLDKGTLYLGSEATTVGNRWMLSNHPSQYTTEFIRDNADRGLYNAGLIGGDRETVMAFLTELLHHWQLGSQHGDHGDMGVLNVTAYNFGKPIVTGTKVHTVFKGFEQDNGISWWAHK